MNGINFDGINFVIDTVINPFLNRGKKILVIAILQLSELWTLKKYNDCLFIKYDPHQKWWFQNHLGYKAKFVTLKNKLSKTSPFIDFLFSNIILYNSCLMQQITWDEHFEKTQHWIPSNLLPNIPKDTEMYLTLCRSINVAMESEGSVLGILPNWKFPPHHFFL